MHKKKKKKVLISADFSAQITGTNSWVHPKWRASQGSICKYGKKKKPTVRKLHSKQSSCIASQGGRPKQVAKDSEKTTEKDEKGMAFQRISGKVARFLCHDPRGLYISS